MTLGVKGLKLGELCCSVHQSEKHPVRVAANSPAPCFLIVQDGHPERHRTDRHFVSRISVLAAAFCDRDAPQELVHRLSLRPRC